MAIKHYRAIAKILRQTLTDKDTRYYTSINIAEYLQAIDKRFNKHNFMVECGLGESEEMQGNEKQLEFAFV